MTKKNKKLETGIYFFFFTMLNECCESPQAPLLTDLREILDWSKGLIKEMETVVRDINYSLFGTCDPDVEESCSTNPVSIRDWLNMMRSLAHKCSNVLRDLYAISDHLGISENRLPIEKVVKQIGAYNNNLKGLSRTTDPSSPCTGGWCCNSFADHPKVETANCCQENYGKECDQSKCVKLSCCSNEKTLPCRDWGECSSQVNCWGPYCEEEKCPNHAV